MGTHQVAMVRVFASHDDDAEGMEDEVLLDDACAITQEAEAAPVQEFDCKEVDILGLLMTITFSYSHMRQLCDV